MRTSQQGADAIVIGAGIVGTATALALARTGMQVLLVDRGSPGLACSRGNAGIIATSEIGPLVNFRTMLRVPALLLDPLGPLRISPRALPRLLPWFGRAALSARRARRESATMVLAALCEQSLDAHMRLLPEAARQGLIRRSGMIDAIRDEKGHSLLRARKLLCEQYGIAVETLDSSELCDLEPALKAGLAGGLFHPRVAHVSDPLDMVVAYANAFGKYGGTFRQAPVDGLDVTDSGVRVLIDGTEIQARHVVVAAGTGSPSLLRPFAKAIPLAAERGYHMQLTEKGPALGRPVMFMSDSFVATPLAHGVRLAGTAEFAAENDEPDWRRADKLLQGAKAYLPDLDPAGATRWMGSRSTFPDSLPAIGAIAGTCIHYAFGHQHLGLTLSAITAEMIANMICKRQASAMLPHLSLDRFARIRR